MKLIKTIVRGNKVEDVREALSRLNIADMRITDIRGPAPSTGHRAGYPPGAQEAPVGANALIELVVRDEIVAGVIQTITRAARTEDIGDGHVSVFPLDREGYLLSTEHDSR